MISLAISAIQIPTGCASCFKRTLATVDSYCSILAIMVKSATGISPNLAFPYISDRNLRFVRCCPLWLDLTSQIPSDSYFTGPHTPIGIYLLPTFL